MRYLLFPLLAVAGCSGTSNPCAKVQCGAGRTCDMTNGRCVTVDGGTGGGGGGDAGGAGGGGATAGGNGDGGLECNPPCTGVTKCDPAQGRCVACLSNADCSCPNPLCLAGNCVGVAPDDGGIRPEPPSAEACAQATPFDFFGCGPRSFRFRTTLSGADDEQGVCSAANGQGRDRVFVLRLDATYDLRLDVAPVGGSSVEPVVYVRRMPCDGQELACVDSGGPFAASLLLKSRVAGDYAIFLDTYDAATGGEVEVTVSLLAPSPPPNDTCLTAEAIATDGGSIRVDLALAENDEAVSCNRTGVGSRDMAWRFVVAEPSDIVARVTPVSPGVEPFIELRQDGCGPGSARGCAAPSASGATQLRLRGATPGVYTLVVESYDAGSAGPVDVSVAVGPPSPPLQHDTCAAPRDIVFADGGTFTELEIDTTTAMDDENGSCNPAGGPEYVYRLRLLSPQRVTLTASPSPGSFADPVLYVRGGTCTGGELAGGCSDDPANAAATETVTTGSGTLPPGDYFIFVESYGDSVGPTRLTVSATP